MGVKLGAWKLGVNEKGGRFSGLLGGKLSIFTRQLVVGHYYGPRGHSSYEREELWKYFVGLSCFRLPYKVFSNFMG